MLTSVFKKSSLLNYGLVILALITFFILQFLNQPTKVIAQIDILNLSFLLSIHFITFFLVNFIVKKNGLTRNSSYTLLFFLLFYIVFPAVFLNKFIVLANLFLLFSFRRLISLQNLKSPKSKIFDASVWIFLASLFSFWCVLFVLLVYVSIIFHVSRDFRNWLIPFLAAASVAIIYIMISLMFDISWLQKIKNDALTFIEFDYFQKHLSNFSFAFYVIIALYLVSYSMVTLTTKPIVLQASYKKMIFAFLIGITLFLISANKQNDLLIFTFFPLAVMCTNTIEYSQNKLYQEIILGIMLLFGLIGFFIQL
jgi:hypothetical protein